VTALLRLSIKLSHIATRLARSGSLWCRSRWGGNERRAATRIARRMVQEGHIVLLEFLCAWRSCLIVDTEARGPRSGRTGRGLSFRCRRRQDQSGGARVISSTDSLRQQAVLTLEAALSGVINPAWLIALICRQQSCPQKHDPGAFTSISIHHSGCGCGAGMEEVLCA